MPHGQSQEQGVYFPVGRLRLMAGWLKMCYETQKTALQGGISLAHISRHSPHHDQVKGNSICPQGTPVCHQKDMGKTAVRGRNTHVFHPGLFSPVCEMQITSLPAEGLARQDLLVNGGTEVSD